MLEANEHLLNSTVRHAILVERFKEGETRRILALLNKVDRDILRQLRKRGIDRKDTVRSKKIRALISELRRINSQLYGWYQTEQGKDGVFTRSLKRFADSEAEFAILQLTNASPVDLGLVFPSAETIRAAVTQKPLTGRLLKEWVRDLERSKIRRIEDQINIGIVEGESTDEIVRRIKGTRAARYKDGILEVDRRHVTSIVRTAVNHVSNHARGEVFKRNADVISQLQWVSTLDARTTPICQSRDGKTWDLDEAPRPPAHIGCRSTIVPVTKSWRDMGIDRDDMTPPQRAALNGAVPANQNYPVWLRKQGRPFIEDVLGKKKAELFITRRLTLDKFVNDRGTAYTLDQLRAKYPSAF
jgi:SPP1 gp7 family putative phage head morphogenesis protein